MKNALEKTKFLLLIVWFFLQYQTIKEGVETQKLLKLNSNSPFE